jgi:hypothetical protein
VIKSLTITEAQPRSANPPIEGSPREKQMKKGSPPAGVTATQLAKPIIIVGTGRCGSTALHCLMARHPNLAWFSGFLNKHPDGNVNRWLMRAIDWPVIGRYFTSRFQPWECYPFWEEHCRGFSEPCRDLTADDVTPRTHAAMRGVMERLVTAKRSRLLIKITGWPRLGFLREIFPDAKFIHVIRDGRAVANSNLAVDFWDGWRGPQSWRFGSLSPAEQDVWDRMGRSFVALAGIEWNKLVTAARITQSVVLPENFLEVRYEDLCADRFGVMWRILDCCELPMTSTFESELRQFPLESQNDKWRKDLTRRQQEVLENVMRDQLQSCGYI